ncbi:MAG: inositol-3-phosphate synthase, partial [Candidatus Dadabacteria bacterium]
AAEKARVLSPEDMAVVGDFLEGIVPMAGVHDPETVRRLEPDNALPLDMPRREQVDILRQNIRDAMTAAGASRAVSVMIMSTEVQQNPLDIHQSLDAFEQALDANDRRITPTQLYAYACLREQVPFANGTPNMALQLPAFQELARETNTPIAGRDLKTGQTMMKTALAPAFKARMLGVRGWFSTNILGNRDGEVLDDPDAFRSKEKTKGGVLDSIFQPDRYPDLYGDYYHKVRINYYPPRGDDKEGWDNIDIYGWLGYPMQIKVDFLCRDSILAAPIVHDLALFLDLAKRARWRGTQEWLGFYFKEPMAAPGAWPIHDLFAQHQKLENTLRFLGGEEVLDHLGLDYFGDDLYADD